jgi:sugar phosphate isomerase/epimerase
MKHHRIDRRDFIKASFSLGMLSSLGLLTYCQTSANDEKEYVFGCYTRPWSDFEYKVAFDEIARAGYKAVGLMTTKSENRLIISIEHSVEQARTVGEQAKKRGLSIVSAWGGRFNGEKSVEAGVAGLQKLVDNCEACGCTSLLIGGTKNQEIFDQYYTAVAESCDYAQEKGVELALKPHGGLNTTGAQCRQIIEKVNHPNFRLWYDPGNIYYYTDGELEPVNDAPVVAGLVTGMCVKDYKHPKQVAVTPSTGQVNFQSVLEILQRGGFTGGPMVVETLEPGELDELHTRATQTLAWLKELTGQTS